MQRSHWRCGLGRFMAISALGALLGVTMTGPASGQSTAPAPRTMAQLLVESTQAKHADVDELGISAVTSRGCVGVASTDKSDIGEKCEADDVRPLHTGKVSVDEEKDGFDVSLPLHDMHGTVVGVVGVGFRKSAGQTAASVTAEAQAIAADMAAHIPSKASLLARAK